MVVATILLKNKLERKEIILYDYTDCKSVTVHTHNKYFLYSKCLKSVAIALAAHQLRGGYLSQWSF